MTRQSAALFGGLGEGMIAMGGEVQNVFNAERANKVEEIKAQRLASMQQSEHMMSNLFKLDTSRTQKEQFAATQEQQASQFEKTHSLGEEQLAASVAQAEATHELAVATEGRQQTKLEHEIAVDYRKLSIQDARVAIEQQSLEQAKDQFDKTLEFKYKQLFETASVNRFNEAMADKNYDQAERELEFRREQFGHTKDVDKLKIALQEQSLALQSKTLDSEIAYRASQIDLANKRLEHDERSVQDKLAHAREELSFKKLSFEEEMTWKEADRSEKMALARAQFDHLQVSDERKDELARDRFDYLQKSDDQKHQFLLKKFEFEKLSTKEREKIEREKLAISKDLADLEGEKESRAIARDKQVEWYEKAIVEIKKSDQNLAEKRVKIEEQKLVLTEDASERDKWKITTIPEYGWVDADDPVDKPTYEKIGERIVLINLDEPELQDVRMLTDDGQWEGGTPEGWKSYAQQGLDALREIMAKDNVSIDVALETAKNIEGLRSYKWSDLEELIVLSGGIEGANVEGANVTGSSNQVNNLEVQSQKILTDELWDGYVNEAGSANLNPLPKSTLRKLLNGEGKAGDIESYEQQGYFIPPMIKNTYSVMHKDAGIVTGDDTGVITSKGPIHDASEAVGSNRRFVPGPRGVGGKWVED